jgi:[ribosomal protein S5]-alanine N-acetyltransferase
MSEDRLRMEPLAAAHAPRLFDGLADTSLYTYIPDDPPPSVAELAARFDRLAAGSPRSDEVWRNWVMFAACDSRVVGTLQASVFADRRAMIAYMILPPYWRRGYGAEGVRWMLRQVAEQDHAELAEAFIDTRNAASIALVKRLDFRHRTTLVDADTFKGSSSDEHVYEKQLTPPRRER